MPGLYIVKRMQRMDVSLLYVHGKDAPGHQRGINIDSWVAHLFPFDARAASERTVRIRDIDTNEIREFRAPVEKLHKNVRLHGEMMRGEGYRRYSINDLLLLKISPRGDHKMTLAFFNRSRKDREVFKALTDTTNTKWKRNIGVVREDRRAAVEDILSRRDTELFFDDEVQELESEYLSERLRRRMSLAAFARIQKLCSENGEAGEQLVLGAERARLISAGRPDLAAQVKHISVEDVTSPFDILSFEGKGPRKERFIEVKSTSGDSMSFEISAQEWEFARRKGKQHRLYRVTRVTSANPEITVITDIAGPDQAKQVSLVPTSYRATYAGPAPKASAASV